MGGRVMPWEAGYDAEWDGPEAIAKWRFRGIRNVDECEGIPTQAYGSLTNRSLGPDGWNAG